MSLTSPLLLGIVAGLAVILPVVLIIACGCLHTPQRTGAHL